MDLEALIRTVPGYPQAGRDVPRHHHAAEGSRGVPSGHRHAGRTSSGRGLDAVAGIESRGFIVGAALAHALGTGFVPLRKHGKLPAATVGRDYQLEYGADRIEMHVDAVTPGAAVLLADDLIATGGTAEAALRLLEDAGAHVVECCFLVDLPDLGGRARLEALGRAVHALVSFPGD